MRDLIAAGVESSLVDRVMKALIFSAETPRSILGTSAEIILARRRKADRERKKYAYSLNKTAAGKQTMSAAVSEENAPAVVAASSLTSLLPSSVGSPLEAKQGSKEEVVERRPRADRGTRLPTDWTLSPANIALAIEHGHTPQEFETEFKDFWVGVPGTRGRKCDWEATARNRIKETSKRRRVNGNGIGRPNANGITGTVAGDRARELAQLAREREIEAGIRRPDDPF